MSTIHGDRSRKRKSTRRQAIGHGVLIDRLYLQLGSESHRQLKPIARKEIDFSMLQTTPSRFGLLPNAICIHFLHERFHEREVCFFRKKWDTQSGLSATLISHGRRPGRVNSGRCPRILHRACSILFHVVDAFWAMILVGGAP